MKWVLSVNNSSIFRWGMKGSLFLFLFLLLLPAGFVQEIVNVDHFYSSMHMFENAFDHRFTFGVDIVDNVGPFGYLHYPIIYTGGAFLSKIAWFAIQCAFYVYFSLQLAKRIPSLVDKSLFLLSIFFFPIVVTFPWFSYEILPRLIILFSGLFLFHQPKSDKRIQEFLPIALLGFFYSFLTLEKASNVYFLGFLITLLSIYWAKRGLGNKIIALWSSFVVGLVTFWLLAGQKLSHFFTYFRSMQIFIDSYQHVLSIDLEANLLFISLFLLGIIALCLLIRFATATFRSQSFDAFFPVLLISASLFLSWKHACMRNINSYGILAYILPCILALVFFFPFENKRQRSRLLHSGYVALFLLFFAFTCEHIREYESRLNINRSLASEVKSRLTSLLDYRPYKKLEALKAKYAALKDANSFPLDLKSSLINKTVDELGSTPELIFLNGLKYAPRPVPIEHIVANRGLNKKNHTHFKHALSAPDFLLLPDFRLHVSDTFSYLSAITNYHISNAFQGWLVLEKNKEWKKIRLKKNFDEIQSLNNWIFLKNDEHSFLWVKVDLQKTLFGKLISFLYLPEKVRLEILLENGTIIQKDVALTHLSSGFLINPILKGKEKTKYSDSFCFETPFDLVKAFRICLNKTNTRPTIKSDFKLAYLNVAISSEQFKTQNLLISDAQREIDLIRDLSTFPPSSTITLDSLLGKWEINGKEASIELKGDQPILLNEFGSSSLLVVSEDRSHIVARDWNCTKGRLMGNKTVLKWDNGTSWNRPKNEPLYRDKKSLDPNN